MSTVNLIVKEDGFIQYIDKVLAKRSTDSKKLKISSKNKRGKTGLQLHRTRRNIFNDKKEGCKALQITSAVAGGAAGVAMATATAAASIPFFGAPVAGVSAAVAAASYTAKAAADVAYIELDCASIPFDEIKEIMDKRFNNLDKAVDRNYAALQEVSKLVSKTLSAVEETRMEMHQNFNQVLASIKTSRIGPVLSRLNGFIEYFDTEKEEINKLSKDNYITRINEINNVLTYLKDSRTPKGESLSTHLNDIIKQNFAIPSDSDDTLGISALYALHYGTQTYVSVMFFLIEQHSYLADYYYQNGDLKKFNEHFGKIQEVFQKFRDALVVNNALIDKVTNIINNVQATDFIADDRILSGTLSEKLKELENIKERILEMSLPIIKDTPAKFTGKITFKPPSISTPIGEWKDDRRVYYAMQYKDGDKFSKLGAWSEPLIVYGEANPTLRIPVDAKRRTRLIYRKFNENKPQLVGIIEDKYKIEFRDINRDLYNAASWPNKKLAVGVVDTLLQNGANSTAIFEQGRVALHSAAEGGNPDIVIKKLKPSNINIRDDNGYTPLHVAAEAGNDDLIKILVANGANVNAKTYTEELTPIHLAARKGYDYTVRSLMECKGIDMNLGDNEGFTPLHSAVAGGLPVIEAIISHKDVDVNRKSDRGLSALHLAALNGYMDIAEALVRSGKLNVNIESEGNMTPFHFATVTGHFDMVKFLQKNGANINAKSVTNWTALHFAISLKKDDITLELLKSREIDLNAKTEDYITPMHIACGSGQDQIVEKILEKRPSHIVKEILSTKTKDGLTPLHIGTMNKDKNIVATLCEKGADIEAKTNQGQTPLLAAAASGNLDIVKYLLSKKALINAVDMNGNSVLNLAAENGHLNVVKYFVENKGFGLEKGNTVISSAIPNGHLKIIKYLVDNKGVSARCVFSTCPLSVASQYGNLDIVRYLVDKDKDYALYRVLHKAIEYGHLNIVKYLIEEKQEQPNRYESGSSPMQLAAMYGWLSIVKYLHEKHQIPLDIDRNHYRSSVVQLAIGSSNLYLVKYLMESNVISNGLEDPEYNQTPLHFAITSVRTKSLNDKQSASVLRYLVDEKNYNVNAQEKYGYTPLHRAVECESFYAIKFLIARGADIYKRSTSYETPLDLATKYKKSIEIQEFLQMQDVCNKLMYNMDPEIKPGYNVNAQCVDVTKGFMDDIYHTTALHLAVSTDATDTVELLLTRGANVNARDEEGNLPLHFAVENENVELIKTLIQKGADVTLKNLNNQTPKDLAKEKHAMNIVEILKQAQIDRNGGRLTRVKKSVNPEVALGTESSPKPHKNALTYIIEEACGNSGAAPLCLSSSSDNKDSIDVRGAQCLNSNISLGLLLAQNFLNKKFPLPKFPHIKPAQARVIALNISKKFEELLKKYTKNAGDVDFYQLYVDIEANIKNEKFSNVPKVLREFAKNVCGKDVDTVSGKIDNMFHKL